MSESPHWIGLKLVLRMAHSPEELCHTAEAPPHPGLITLTLDAVVDELCVDDD